MIPFHAKPAIYIFVDIRDHQTKKNGLHLYSNNNTFCVSPRTNYHFKMCLSLASLGMSSIIKEDVRSMEIWIDGHPEKYRLDAKNKKLKEEFAAELKKGILKAKENPSTSRIARQPQAFQVSEQTIIYRVFNLFLFSG